MKIIYRISDTGYNKVKPKYINNETCLINFVKTFIDHTDNEILVLADNLSTETTDMVNTVVGKDNVKHVNVGHGAGTFNIALDIALEYDDNEIVYFVENDYLHKMNSDLIIQEGLYETGAEFVSLYDHPDKYIDATLGGNPFVQEGGEVTRVILTSNTHWKITNSTTMTFAAKVSALKKHEDILRKHTSGTHPNDFQMFLDLRKQGAALITPIPGYSTHGESAWLSPLTDWSKI